MRKIVLEEHFSAPGMDVYGRSALKTLDADAVQRINERLSDFSGVRLAEMDEVGIDYAVLSQAGPGVQAERDHQTAIRRAKESNDYLARQIADNPARFGGFAMLPMANAADAADELARCVSDYGFKGALVNGHSCGTYYDAPQYDALWERLQALDVPIYLHPASFHDSPHAFSGRPELSGAIWGWGVETATHALRLLFGGVFDRFPNLRIILGHMGEGLPFQRWRFDSRARAYSYDAKLKRSPSAYIGTNILVTTSGICSHAALSAAVDELGETGVMFSIDYPYESTQVAADFIDSAPLDAHVLEAVCSGNARRLLKLEVSSR